MLLVITCWAHVEITVWMYPKYDWWIHWEKNDPEPTIYPRCSHWFPGHLAPSATRSAWKGDQSAMAERSLALASREVFPTLPKQAPGFGWMKEIFFVFEINVVEIQFEMNHCQPTCERFLGAN